MKMTANKLVISRQSNHTDVNMGTQIFQNNI